MDRVGGRGVEFGRPGVEAGRPPNMGFSGGWVVEERLPCGKKTEKVRKNPGCRIEGDFVLMVFIGFLEL